MGSPQQPSAEQYSALEAAGQLGPLVSPQWIEVRGGAIALDLTLPRQSVSLLQMTLFL